MSATISSINYCPVKSISFQSVNECEIKKNIGITGDRIFAFTKGLDLDQAKLIEKSPEDRKGKWNKILTLKNSPVLNKYNFLYENEKLTLTTNEKKILTIDVNKTSERQLLSDKINGLRTINKNIDGKLTDGDKNLKNQLALYGNVYANILANSGGNQDYTIDGKVEDLQLEV